MNLFQLEYFIILAETLSYTKASLKLHITQPTLSRLIINLEHEIGSQLFVRNKRDVKLTSSGKVFYTEIKKTLGSYHDAVKKVQDMENGTAGIINLGFMGTTMANILPKIINKFNDEFPEIKINPFDYSYSRIMEAMGEGQLDMAICPDMELNILPKLTKKLIFTDAMCIVVHQNHKFAALEAIDFSSFKDEPFINMQQKASSHDHNFINHIYTEKDYLPNTVYEASSLLNMLVMVDCQIGITIMASHMKQYASNTVRFIPINDLDTAFKVVCLHSKSTNESILKLLNVIDECFPRRM
jgi:DNA-binding transcriptional LysR family regulator